MPLEQERRDEGEMPVDESDETPLDEFNKKLSKSGSGGGVSLHFNASVAEQYHLNEDTDVTVRVCEEDGAVYFRIDPGTTGFTNDEFRGFAQTYDWTLLQSQEFEEGEEYLRFEDHSKNVTVDLKPTSRVNGAVLNDVMIRSVPIELTEDTLDRYEELCVAAMRKGLDVQIDDSEGYWSQLQASPNHPTDDAPDTETLQQLVARAETVTARLVSRRARVHTSLEEVAEDVAAIRQGMRDLSPSE
jgi:hypothetical protein